MVRRLTAFFFLILLAGCAPFHWGNEIPESQSNSLSAAPPQSSTVLPLRAGTSNAPDLSWPLPKRYAMGDGFNPVKGKHQRKHLGVDFPAPRKTPIFAAHSGWVSYTGRKFHGYGKMVILDNGNGWQTLYAHMSKIITKQGSHVRQGDKIGEVGATGHAHGSHLHFELMQESEPLDPADYLSSSNRKIATQ